MRRDRAVVDHLFGAGPRLAALAVVAALCAGCAGGRDGDAPPRPGGLVARLRSTTSAAVGTARVFDARNGVTLQLYITNMIPGTYRVALHERGNCSSANMYSAGPAWAPPGFAGKPGDLLPPFTVNMEGTQAGFVARIEGVSVEGPTSILGRSVVIHWGNVVGEAFPGQPNNRILCGVLEPATALRF